MLLIKGMGKKELLATALYRAGVLGPVRLFQRSQLVVVTYHRIKPNEAPARTPFDAGVFGPSQAAFQQQVVWLKRNFDVLTESELLDVLRRPTFRGRFAAITFDDGYRDNYTLAYPVLRAHDVPATFFVCPGVLDSRRVGWWDLIAYFIRHTKKPALTVRGTTLAIEAAGPHLLHMMKLRTASETEGLMEELSTACGVPMPDPSAQSEQFMTWDEVLEVSRNGVAIGSHTHTHRVLATLDEDAQRWELSESRATLEARLGRPPRTLAYPVGGYDHFTPATMRIAREVGYEGAFSFHTGANYSGACHPYNLRRISCTQHLDALFAAGAYLPQVFSWFHPAPVAYTGHTVTTTVA